MGKRTMKLATRGKRFGAGVIDIAIPFVCYIIIMIAAFAVSARSNPMPDYGFGFEEDFGYGYGYGYGFETQSNPGWFLALMGILGLVLLAYIIVECVFFAKSMSIGKAILGLQVVSSTDGNPIGFGKMLFREVIVKQASNVFLLGFIWILIDDRNRGWHDKILDTYVVDLRESAKLNAVKAPAPAPAQAPMQAPTPASPAHDEVVADVELKPAPAAAPIETPAEPVVEAVTPAVEAATPIETPVEPVVEAVAPVAEAAAIETSATEVAPAEPVIEAVEAVAPVAETAAPVEAVTAATPVEPVIEAAAPIDSAPEAPAAPLPKKPVIRLDVDEDE